MNSNWIFLHQLLEFDSQGIVGCIPTNVPLWKTLYKPYSSWVFMGYNPQESLENTINAMGTRTLGVHPIVP